MLRVLRVDLPPQNPIVGSALTPYVLVLRPDRNTTTDDVPESAPLGGYFLRYRWYRDRKETICSVHPTEKGTLQCVDCSKRSSLVAKSYHCSSQCYMDAWPQHRALHEQVPKDTGNVYNNAGAGPSTGTVIEVGGCKTYTPTADDIGYVLKFECAVAYAQTKQPVGHPVTVLTSWVIPAPSPSHPPGLDFSFL